MVAVRKKKGTCERRPGEVAMFHRPPVQAMIKLFEKDVLGMQIVASCTLEDEVSTGKTYYRLHMKGTCERTAGHCHQSECSMFQTETN